MPRLCLTAASAAGTTPAASAMTGGRWLPAGRSDARLQGSSPTSVSQVLSASREPMCAIAPRGMLLAEG